MSYEQNLDLKPNLRDFEKNKNKTAKSQSAHQLADRPVMVKTLKNNEEETSDGLKPRVELSLNKDNRWKVMDNPYLLRDDAEQQDFRVVEHALTRNNKLMGINADVTKVYIENEDLEQTKTTKGGKTTTLKSLTHVPEEKEKKSRKSKKPTTSTEELKSSDEDEPKDTVAVQYDIYKAHTNPVMLKEKKNKGSKRSSHRNWNMSEIEDELESYYDDEDGEDSEKNLHVQKHNNTTSKTTHQEACSTSQLKALSEYELDIIRQQLFAKPGVSTNRPVLKYPRLDFLATTSYRSRHLLETEQFEKVLKPLKLYQLHIAKRNIEETDKMFSDIINRIRIMMNEPMRDYRRDFAFAKLIYSKDEVYIDLRLSGEADVCIIPKTLLMDNPFYHHQDTITNKEITEYLEQAPMRYEQKIFFDGFVYADLIIDEKWDLSKLEEQLEPSIAFLRVRMWYPEEIKSALKEAIRKAVEKTIHQSPIAVCFLASNQEDNVKIIVRKNWKQPNQSVIYSTQVTNDHYRNRYYYYSQLKPISIQFVILL